jgi:hypothetical protein
MLLLEKLLSVNSYKHLLQSLSWRAVGEYTPQLLWVEIWKDCSRSHNLAESENYYQSTTAHCPGNSYETDLHDALIINAKEKRHAVSLLIRPIDNPVHRALVKTVRPSHEHISNVDDQAIFDGGCLYPLA